PFVLGDPDRTALQRQQLAGARARRCLLRPLLERHLARLGERHPDQRLGRLVEVDEPAESLIGMSFAEAGEMAFEEWSEKASPRTSSGELLPLERRPVWIA